MGVGLLRALLASLARRRELRQAAGTAAREEGRAERLAPPL